MVYCIVGKMASGKTTVIKYLAKHLPNVKAIIADEIINNLYKKDQPAYLALQKEFSNKFNNVNGIDKKKLTKFILENKTNLAKIEAITWPLLKTEIKKISIKNNDLNLTTLVELPIYYKNTEYFQDLFAGVILIKRNRITRLGSFAYRYKWNPYKLFTLNKLLGISYHQKIHNYVLYNKGILDSTLKSFLKLNLQ